jgi:hypothetical protein
MPSQLDLFPSNINPPTLFFCILVLGSSMFQIRILTRVLLTLRTEIWVAANQSRGNLEPLWIGSCPPPTREGSLEKCHNMIFSKREMVGRFMGK